MTLFQYRAIDSDARKVTGVVEAQTESEAKEKLRKQGLMVSLLSTTIRSSRRDYINRETLLTLTHQLSQLINAGVPLYQSLLTLEEQYQSEKYHRILLSICDQVKSGKALSEAMKIYPESFDNLYTSMIGAGEASGKLGLVLERLSELLAKQIKLKKEITTAMIYPSILAVFSMLVIALLLGFVVPSIEGIFEGRPLNAFTNFVLGLSSFARHWFWLYIPLIISAGTGLYLFARSPKGALQIETLLLKTPLIKTLMVQAAVSRFSRTLATLLEGGVQLLDGLTMAKGVMNNQTLEKDIERAADLVVQGKSLSYGLKQSKHLPPLVPRMVAIGEDSGKLGSMLSSVADMYEENLEKSLSQLVALAQPVILIIMGGVIGLVMVAILLPMSDIASLTQQ